MKLSSLLLSLLLCSFSAEGALVITHFDDLTNVPVDGFFHLGVNYMFTVGGVASAEALYGVPFPQDSIIGDTVLLGPTGDLLIPSSSAALNLSFASPTNVLVFAIALSSSAGDGFELTLTDSQGNVGTPILISTDPDFLCDPSVNPCFSEATYNYMGTTPIAEARLNFASSQAESFAIGTLEYETAIPEPGSFVSFAGGLALLLCYGSGFLVRGPLFTQAVRFTGSEPEPR